MKFIKYCILLLALFHTNAQAFELQGVSFKGSTDLFMNYHEYQQTDNQWFSDVNFGYSSNAAIEFSIKNQHFLVEYEFVNLIPHPPTEGIPTDPNAPPPVYEEKEGLLLNEKFYRFNLLYKYTFQNISVYTGLAILTAQIDDIHTIHENGVKTFDDSSEYIATHLGINTQIDLQLIKLKGISLNLNITPFNYYYDVGNNSGIGLKLAYNPY